MINRFEQFSTAISCIYRCIQKIERVEMSKYGLKGPHAQCLLAMSRYPEGVTASRLCVICDKDKAAISRTVSELERENMVVRAAHNGNRYRALLTLTEQGEAVAARVDELARLAVEKAGEGLMNDGQRQLFYQILSAISDNLQAICTDGLEESTPSLEDSL